MLALSAPMLVVPLAAAVLTRWLSPGVVSGIGLTIAAAGLYALGLALHRGANASAIGPMLAIGTGAAMPWGLMDGLSVSIVPKERAGMATEIFSTTRVAGKGIALACVSALRVAYADAFSALLSGLAALTLGCAIAVLVSLRRTREPGPDTPFELEEHAGAIMDECDKA
ncbi:hypothetical protein LMG27952_06600 [Paraburkholderia hiiakae]|uniref:MFS transporter n=1 Tax=Paraburkholderia hiiakae TaxID=1081782 RepID=A0ABN7IDJ0_9BURK|nr:hypothetical protein LMG27952_06600 [Paraburkholderia hiiakae]